MAVTPQVEIFGGRGRLHSPFGIGWNIAKNDWEEWAQTLGAMPMDAAYCSAELRAHCNDLGHAPLIDHNPRGGEKLEFDPAQAVRYHERTVAERMNARLKDEFGGNHVWVKGNTKVMSHLMFGVLVLTVALAAMIYRLTSSIKIPTEAWVGKAIARNRRAYDPAAVTIRSRQNPSKISFQGAETIFGLIRAGSFARGSIILNCRTISPRFRGGKNHERKKS